MKNKAGLTIATITLALACGAVFAATAMPRTVIPNKLQHKEILTHLLTAEMAMNRNMLDVALENYLIVARSTHDPEVAQLATEISLELQDAHNAIESATIWAQAAPEDLQAQMVALTLYISTDQEKIEPFLKNLLEHSPADLDQSLIVVYDQLSPNGKKQLTTATLALANLYPKNAYAQLAAAQLSAVQLDITTANTKLQQSLKLQPSLTSAIELQAKLIRHEKNNDQPALDYLDKEVNKYPEDSALRMFYALALIDNENSSKAIPHLQTLTKDTEYGGDAFLLIGEDNITNGKYTNAETNIKNALKFESTVDKARYYLAQLAEYNKKNNEAITWYEQVESTSEYHTPAFLRAAYLYSLNGEHNNALNTLQNSSPNTFDDQKQILLTEIDILIDVNDLDQALENSNKVIAVLPNDVDFLYARSVVLGMLKKYKAAERDLRAVLNEDPNNANSLNALGFILTIQPDRIGEAEAFIQKALSLNPNNPAFMDTLGWYQYKTGNIKEAVALLEKAYKLSGDNEIAAHLGEVLWTTGQKDAARKVWQQALLSAENKDIIHETLTRLNVNLTDVRINAQ